MNKKFSTLMAGFLLTSAFASAKIDVTSLEKATFDKNAATAGKYVIVHDADGTLDVNDLVLEATLTNTTLTHSAKTLNQATLKNAVWSLEVKEEGVTGGVKYYSYALKNVTTGKYLTFAKTGDIIKDASKAGKAEVGAENSSYFKAEGSAAPSTTSFSGNGILYLLGANTANGLNLTTTNVTLSTGTAVTLYKYVEEQEANIAKMNEVMGGEGFNLTSKADAFEGNIFKGLNLKAFEVEDLDNVPNGTYFVVADETMPATLKGKTAKLDTKAEFDAATFVAVDPAKNLNINEVPRDKGRGFWFKTVKGSDFHFQSAEGQESKGEEIYVGNACFNVINPTVLDFDTYQIYTKTARGLKEAGKDDQIALGKQFIGTVKDQDVDYVITNTENAVTFTLTNGTLYEVDQLLNDTDAPAIYTIQFVSGKDKEGVSEYGQYLTLDKHSTQGTLRFASVEEINELDPKFQFVVTKVEDRDENKKYETVTLKNRQTGVEIAMSLYKEGDAYVVYPASEMAEWDVYPETYDSDINNGGVSFSSSVKLNATKIVLTPVAVEDKFASFVNREETTGLVTFALAKNNEAAPEFYVGVSEKKATKNAVFAYADALDAAQFELVKSEEPETITNEYIYLKNDRVVTSTEKDTVAFYTYKIKAFDADENANYVVWDNGFKVAANSALSFVIKENIDGSVALIDFDKDSKKLNYTDENVSKTQFLAVDSKNIGEGKAAWITANTYDLTTILSEGLKTFMVEESPLVSYEAVPQHVSFEAVRGGFLTMDENKDARLAIASEASEDLTFWIDTVHSNLNIPSFYITKGGNFLYNAADSATYYANRKNYRYNLENKADGAAKLIFKAGELVSSDTLKTVVDGKSVLVAEKDNAPKKIKGGLKNFQFQIVRAEEGSDEYVIRKDGKYVCQYNNYFYMKADKDEAYRFIIEKQSAPTANEDVAVSEVTVIAGEGQLTIANAAGKKVVVSNILGQVVANTVLSSDNATIAAPQGVVVVAVEGEEAIKAIVK